VTGLVAAALIWIFAVALGLVLIALDCYWRRAHALDGLVDPRVLTGVRARVKAAQQTLRANRVNG